jgi:hypothetical protein
MQTSTPSGHFAGYLMAVRQATKIIHQRKPQVLAHDPLGASSKFASASVSGASEAFSPPHTIYPVRPRSGLQPRGGHVQQVSATGKPDPSREVTTLVSR